MFLFRLFFWFLYYVHVFIVLRRGCRNELYSCSAEWVRHHVNVIIATNNCFLLTTPLTLFLHSLTHVPHFLSHISKNVTRYSILSKPNNKNDHHWMWRSFVYSIQCIESYWSMDRYKQKVTWSREEVTLILIRLEINRINFSIYWKGRRRNALV